ncbi:hypothetical protein SR882_01470 [Guyparkeria halophila]|uniref:Uncharacterized protein n=1 Tax=Guyparkeria halophila TaxID=47960 RepID=A0ABZ0YZE6_9GAMM|nr:hypothetical protein [Guyparkeria halophila]WQH16597.1 hypothetical protein SR882_01470 [Guyparkeria halophila]
MTNQTNPALRHLGWMTLLEGGSLIALVVIAMPLKYPGKVCTNPIPLCVP